NGSPGCDRWLVDEVGWRWLVAAHDISDVGGWRRVTLCSKSALARIVLWRCQREGRGFKSRCSRFMQCLLTARAPRKIGRRSPLVRGTRHQIPLTTRNRSVAVGLLTVPGSSPGRPTKRGADLCDFRPTATPIANSWR